MFNICERGQACTCWFDEWFGKSWKGCCKDHDKRYKLGLGKSKLSTDINLFRCVKSNGGFVIASIMFIGVSIFGWYYWNKYRKEINGKY